jgi:hypothetical protein
VAERCLGTAPGGGVKTRRLTEDEILLAAECMTRVGFAEALADGGRDVRARKTGLGVCEGGSGIFIGERTRLPTDDMEEAIETGLEDSKR